MPIEEVRPKVVLTLVSLAAQTGRLSYGRLTNEYSSVKH